MKCKQRSCQRTKNLKPSGNCTVCEEAILACKKTHENQPRKLTHTVETDLKLMISTHEKLTKGEVIEKDVVSTLLLGGVINILGQHDAIIEMENRMKSLEIENTTNKSRIEALENWILKHDERVKHLDEALKRLDKNGVVIEDNKEIVDLKKKVIGLELDISGLKMSRQERLSNQDSSRLATKKDNQKTFMKKCKLCDEKFTKNSDLEHHMVDEHGREKKFDCESCGKKFFLQWRLKQHVFIHTEKVSACQYFLNEEHCPFDLIGCKFSHIKEVAEEEMIEDIEDDGSTDDDECYDINENQCHLCKQQLNNRDDLWEHVEASHREYFQGMLEVAQANRS